MLYTFKKIFKKIGKSENKSINKKLISGEVVKTDDGILIKYEKDHRSNVNFRDVEEISVYKRDLFAIDLVCVAFRIADKTFEIDEHMIGFCSVRENLSSWFAGIDDDWFYNVTFPPFETNQKIIWKKM